MAGASDDRPDDVTQEARAQAQTRNGVYPRPIRYRIDKRFGFG